MTRSVSALTFCLTLLGAPTVRAGGSAGSVDALTLPKMPLHSCAQRATCDDGVPLSLHRKDLKCTICGAPPEPAPELPSKAKQQFCDVLRLLPLVPLPASCHSEPSQRASINSTAQM